jgi:bifunctional non-homologous end joining protein LigD
MRDPLAGLPEQAREQAVAAEQPSWTDPMLATLTDRRFSDPGWVFEPKLDGERCLAFRKGPQVRLLSRIRKRLDDHYPELAEALAAQEADDFVVDGEVVAFEGGRSSFARLQRRMQLGDPDAARRTGVPVCLYLFDVLHLHGQELTRLGPAPPQGRAAAPAEFRDPLRLTPHRNADGEAYWRQACRKGWEGVIAKRADAPYRHDRSGDWLKFKCVNEQEFVIGGHTDPKGSRHGFGALLLSYYHGDDLVFAGKVGTGFDDELLERLRRRLTSLEQDRPPFSLGRLPSAGVHWVRPELVAQIGFSEWTGDGQLRHPRFLGLRRDKRPREVVRERPQ